MENEKQLDDDWSSMENPHLACLADEFERQYYIIDAFDKDKTKEWELRYLTELLTQIKYVLRQKNKKMEVVDSEK